MIAANTSSSASGERVCPPKCSPTTSRKPSEPESLGGSDLFGGEDQFASRLIRWKAFQLIRHPAFNQSDRLDIEQELVLELLRKCDRFDPNLARATTFVSRIVERKAASLIRNRIAEKRDYRRHRNLLNETICDTAGCNEERSQTLESSAVKTHTGQNLRSDEEQLNLQLDITSVLQSLPEDLRRTVELLSHVSQAATARRLGKSRRQVAKEVAMVRELFEGADLRSFL